MRGDLLIELIHEFWTDSDELLEVKRKQISQANKEYIEKWPQLKKEVHVLDISKTYVDLLMTYVFYPHYVRYFQGIPIDFESGKLHLVSDTVRQERALKRAFSGIKEIEFYFAHKSCIDFLHDTISHYFQRYPPSDALVIKWLIINRHFYAPNAWYNPTIKKYLEYRKRPIATMTLNEFEKIVDSRPRSLVHSEMTSLFLLDVYEIPLDPNAPPPESTWESRRPISEEIQKAFAEEHGVEIIDLKEEIVDLTTFQSFPLYYIKKQRFIPLRVEDGSLIVAVVDPNNIEELAEIEVSSREPIKIKIIREQEFYRVFNNLVNHYLKF